MLLQYLRLYVVVPTVRPTPIQQLHQRTYTAHARNRILIRSIRPRHHR